MEDLPREMLNEILSRLDKPSLFQASNVCKMWRQQALTHAVNIKDAGHLGIVAKNGDLLSIIKSVYNEEWNARGLHGACEGGHMDLVKLMMNKGAKDFNQGLIGACRGGHKDLAELMMIMGAKAPNNGLRNACEGGHKDLVELMIHKGGAKNFDYGLYGACIGGHEDLAEFMIYKGATDFNIGFEGACFGGYENIMKLMISKVADYCGFCHKPLEEHIK